MQWPFESHVPRPQSRGKKPQVITMNFAPARDYPRILAIEAESYPDPLDRKRLVAVLGQRNVIPMTARADGAIAGYVIYEHGQSGSHIEILRLAVDPLHRGRGVGRALHLVIAEKVSTPNRAHPQRHIRAILRDDALPAHLWLRGLGYRAEENVLWNHFEDTNQDGYTFTWRPHRRDKRS